MLQCFGISYMIQLSKMQVQFITKAKNVRRSTQFITSKAGYIRMDIFFFSVQKLNKLNLTDSSIYMILLFDHRYTLKQMGMS